MKYGIIDVGSNSIRLSVYRLDPEDNQVYPQFKEKVMAGLAGHVENGFLTEKGIKKAIDALIQFRWVLQNLRIDEVYVFATASLRNVKNTEDALSKIKEATGFEIDVISGKQEATLDFIGATQLIDLQEGILVDIGGASTEIVQFEDGEIIQAVSLPIGSLNMYKKHVSGLIPTKSERKAIKKQVKDEIENSSINTEKEFVNICGVGGSCRAARSLSYELFETSLDSEIPTSSIKEMIKEFEDDSKETIDGILQIMPERIHTLIPGLIILNSVTKHFGCEYLTVSNYGVREGYLFEMVLKNK